MENTNEKEMSPIESFAIIDSMINTAKNKLADDGFYFILWGWLVFAASMINYVAFKVNSGIGEYAWWILLPAGGIVSMVYGWRQGKKEKVKTYIDVYLAYCWIAFGVALALTLVFMKLNGYQSSYFFMMLLYGMATIISGGLLNFKPLIIGGACSFVFAVIAVLTGGLELFLCISGALLCSYIIPGHMLQSKYKSQS